MLGLVREKKPADGFKFEELPEVRDSLKDLVGASMDVYVGTLVGHLLNIGGKTANDVKKVKTRMLADLQKYVQAEILLDAQNHGREMKLGELAAFRL